MIKQRGSPERCKSGIEGLDDISGGRGPQNRLHLVHGDPGVGKTTLAMQFHLAGKAEKEKCLYITLSETAEELQGVAESHGWEMSGIELFDLSAVEHNTLFHPAEVELNQTTDLILREIARIQPQRVVFDSLSELRLLAQSPLKWRRTESGNSRFLRSGVVLMSEACEFQIGPEGIRVGEPLTAFHGVLTGVRQFAGDLSAMLRKQRDSNN